MKTYLQDSVCSLFRQGFIKSLKDPTVTQNDTLNELLKSNADTLFGHQYQFSKIKSLEDYRKSVPVCSYTDIEELIQRIVLGEKNILTQEPVRYFYLTSGTTSGKQKLIPATRSSKRRVWLGILISQGFLSQWNLERNIKRGRGIINFDSRAIGVMPNGIAYGSTIGGLTRKVNHVWNWFSIVPYEVTQIANIETRAYLYWRYALSSEELAYIGAPFMPALISMAKTLSQHSESLIRDIADGTISPDLDLSENQRLRLSTKLQPDLERATFLEQLANQHGGLFPKHIWGTLKWIYTVCGPTFQTYEAKLADLYGKKPIWGIPYLASEGLLGISYAANNYSHIPAITSTFMEFIPEKSWLITNPLTVLLSELEIGHRYEVVMTTWNGLYRYRLGDVIEVDGMFNGIPTFKVIARVGGVISVLWEKTSESQIVSALDLCRSNDKIFFVDFVVNINHEESPQCYQLWIELESNDESLSLDFLQGAFDANLKHANPIYGLLRNRNAIAPPLIKILPSGTFKQFRYRRAQEKGVMLDQIKILHSISDSNYIEMLKKDASRTV
jgi:hypothetical protein